MSEFGDIVQGKCDAFADRVVKLNDYLLTQTWKQEIEEGMLARNFRRINEEVTQLTANLLGKESG